MGDRGQVACGYPLFPAAFLEAAVLSPMHIFGMLVKNQLAVAVWAYF
jgi:hypothetical protein